MVNPEFDQTFKLLSDLLPPFLYSFYTSLLEAGFNDEQAMFLTVKELEIFHNGPQRSDNDS